MTVKHWHWQWIVLRCVITALHIWSKRTWKTHGKDVYVKESIISWKIYIFFYISGQTAWHQGPASVWKPLISTQITRQCWAFCGSMPLTLGVPQYGAYLTYCHEILKKGVKKSVAQNNINILQKLYKHFNTFVMWELNLQLASPYLSESRGDVPLKAHDTNFTV